MTRVLDLSVTSMCAMLVLLITKTFLNVYLDTLPYIGKLAMLS